MVSEAAEVQIGRETCHMAHLIQNDAMRLSAYCGLWEVELLLRSAVGLTRARPSMRESSKSGRLAVRLRRRRHRTQTQANRRSPPVYSELKGAPGGM